MCRVGQDSSSQSQREILRSSISSTAAGRDRPVKRKVCILCGMQPHEYSRSEVVEVEFGHRYDRMRVPDDPRSACVTS